ncbi:MAG: ribosomal L7Ae/L30e/S12e/Gadd45 family protein [Bacillota bacterium]|nr:ribosomal L7Ae/L30e/S12e/Gadd45 family protein [Bacillota bacterium]
MLDSLKNRNKTIGVKQTLRAAEDGLAASVFIAADADPKVVSKLKEICETSKIEIIYAENMKVLGKACGIDVGAAAAAVLK